MQKEIGSEFWTGCTPISQTEYTMRPEIYYKSHLYRVMETISGRTALEHIVEILCSLGKKKAYLPSYCCHTMIEPFLSHRIEVSFYDLHVTKDGIHRLIIEDDYDAILLMDYFGKIDAETIEIATQEKNRGRLVIYDATHSLYSLVETDLYDFVFASYRKWVDINCGFLAWKKEIFSGEIIQNDGNNTYTSIRTKLFENKARFINGELPSKDDYLPLINKAESILEEQYHHKMPDLRSLEVLRLSDADFIKKRRKANARFLSKTINEFVDERVYCMFPQLTLHEVPLFVPVLVAPELRDSLRKHLIDDQIYCPIHWPLSSLHKVKKGSKMLFMSELSLVCDQRYNETDMQRTAESLYAFLHK